MKSIPNPITVNTGEQEKVTKTIDNFFVETKEYIEKQYEVKGPYWEIKTGEITYDPRQRLSDSKIEKQISDHRITYLSYKDWILASVFETRTVFNHVRYTFFRNLDGFEEFISE